MRRIIYILTHGSVHHNSVLIKIQPDAVVCRYLFTTKSLYMFRVSQRPSSGVLKTVTPTSGTGHNIGTATSLQRGLIGTRWREVALPLLWTVPEAAVTVFSTPDDGCCDNRNMYSDFAVNKYLHTVASGWIFINMTTQHSPKTYIQACDSGFEFAVPETERMQAHSLNRTATGIGIT